MNGTKN